MIQLRWEEGDLDVAIKELVFVVLLTKEANFKKKYIVFFGKMRKIEPEQNLFGPEPWIKQTSKQTIMTKE